jgi:hypothetical protein
LAKGPNQIADMRTAAASRAFAARHTVAHRNPRSLNQT